MLIALPSLKHSHTAYMEPDEKYKINVTQITGDKPHEEDKNNEKEEKDEDPNLKQEFNEEVKEIDIPDIIKRNLSHVLMEFERDSIDKKVDFDLCEFPQMISGQVTKKLIELESSKSREYGWHFICSSNFQPGSEACHVNTSVESYYQLTLSEQQAGVFDVIFREFLVDFLLPPKMSNQQIHIVAFRVKRGHDTVLGKTLENIKSIKPSTLLSIASMHKVFFLLLVFMYFANRFVCGKYDKMDYEVESTETKDSEVVSDNTMGYVESL